MISIDVNNMAHDASTNIVGAHTKIKIATIGNNTKMIVFCNAHIGNNVIVGTGKIVSKDIPDNLVVVGNPAKFICTIQEQKTT